MGGLFVFICFMHDRKLGTDRLSPGCYNQATDREVERYSLHRELPEEH